MIRNYYTEAYKGGIVPTISAANLIDGTAKVTETVAQAGVANAATSRTFTLANLNTVIKRGMYLTATAGAGGVAAITINDNVFVEAVTSTATLTTVTLNKPTQTALAQALTFFSIAQSSWKEYNLYIGTVPSPISIQNNISVTGGQVLTLNTPDPRIQVGMTVGGIGIPAGITITAIAADGITLTVTGAAIGTLAANALLTYSFSVLPSISVLTSSNQELTFVNPAVGFVLPVSVVQVTAVTGGLTNLIALE